MNIGIIGAGNISRKFFEATTMVEGAVVTAVSSKDLARSKKFAEETGIANYYDSYEQMLIEGNVELVYIGTTHNFHAENIRLCLEHGKHVLCEKPMVLTEADAKALFVLAKEKGLFLMEAMWSRFLPIAEKAKEYLDSGKIGTAQFANFAIGFCATFDPKGRVYNPDLAGGAVYDIGVYAIEMADYWLPGAFEEVATTVTRAETGVDKVTAILFQKSGVPVTIQTTVSAGFPNFACIYGSEGYLEILHFNTGTSFQLKNRKGEVLETVDCTYENGFQYQLAHAMECIQAGKLTSEVVPPALTIACAKIFDQALSTK